jgi:arylsulfatase A-like enzyme
VLDALAQLQLVDSTLIIVTADHGGAGLDHRADDPRAHFIPWLISGPGIRRNYDLTLTSRPVRIEDTFATACAFLGIDSGTPADESLVISILADKDLAGRRRSEGAATP